MSERDKPLGSNVKLAQIKGATKDFLKKFGPLIFIAVKAGVEHHWKHRNDEQDDGSDTKGRSNHSDSSRDSDDEPVHILTDEVKHLKESLKQKERRAEKKLKEKVRDVETRLDPRSVPGESSNFQPELRNGASTREPYMEREQAFDYRWREPEPTQRYPQFIVPPAVPTPPKRTYLENPPYVRDRDILEYPRMKRKRKHREHDSSIPYRRSLDHDVSENVIRASKVAVLAGAVEAIHVGKFDGEPLGPRSVRVGTAMAATFGSNYSKSKGVEHLRKRDVAADVGTGLLVSRLVHGSVRKMEEREKLQERRWSYCY